MSAPIVRPATPADAEAIARFANALADLTTDDGPGRMTPAAVVSDFLDKTRGLACDVVVIDGRVAGYALHHLAYESAYAEWGRYLSDIYVDEWARRRGGARALMRAVARRAHDEGGAFIWWMAKDTGPEARALYADAANIADRVVAHAATEDAFERLRR